MKRALFCLALWISIVFQSHQAASRPFPSSWGVTAWFLDPVSGSDTNDCQTISTGCQTFQEIASRWGTLSPFFLVPTTITQISSQPTAGADPIILTPVLSTATSVTAAQLTYQCSLPTPVAETFTSVTSKVRTGASGTKLSVTASPGITTGALVCNTTAGKASCAWNYSGSVFTQPLNYSGNNTTFPMSSEVDTWANGDTANEYTFATLIKASIVKARPMMAYGGTLGSAYLLIKNCNIPADTSNGNTILDIGRLTTLVDGISSSMVVAEDTYTNTNGKGQGSSDWIYNGGFSGGLYGTYRGSGLANTGMFQIYGGAITNLSGSGIPSSTFNGVDLDADFLINAGATFVGTNLSGFVENENFTIKIKSGSLDTVSSTGFGGSVWWTSVGGALIASTGALYYSNGSTGGATTFPNSSMTLEVGGSVTACKAEPSAVLTTLLCNLTMSPGTALDTQLGSTSGCLCAGFQGCFCNTLP